MLSRPSRLYVWLPLGLAAYCFFTVVDHARKSDWSRTPVQDLRVVRSGAGYQTVLDVLGQPHLKWTDGHRQLQYRYVVSGQVYRGAWTSHTPLAQPVSVIYDPDHPERSTLAARPPSPVVQGLAWAGLALGLGAAVLRKKLPEAPPRTPAPESSGVASQRARWVFRGLVVTHFSIVLCRRLFDSPAARLPREVLGQVVRYLPPGPSKQMFIDLYPVFFALSFFACLGLISFWRPARHLYLLTWCWWLAAGAFSLVTIDFGIDAFLRHLSWLLGGAVVALSFYGPIGAAFRTREAGEPSGA